MPTPDLLDAFETAPLAEATVTVTVDPVIVDTVDDDTLAGSDREDRMFGGNGWDILSGLADDDVIYGNTGLDTLDGGAGNDLLYGGQDDDLLKGGDGDDSLFGGLNSDTVYVLRNGELSLLEGRDTLSGGAGDDVIYGNQGNDLLFGGADDDTLYGGQGNDRLSGGEGRDVLYGGLGADGFAYAAADEGRDTIHGFDVTEDQILIASGVSVSTRTDLGDDVFIRLDTGTRITLIGVENPDDVAISSL